MWLGWLGVGLAVAGTVHAAVNARLLRRPPEVTAVNQRRVSVLLPVRDEAHRVEPTLRSLLAQTMPFELLVLDDGSTDGTAEVIRRVAPTVRVIEGAPLPPGWLGKPYACQQLADTADPTSDVLVFVDADVVLAPEAIAATVASLDDSGLDLVSPYPRQLAVSPAERLVQPLLQWSWLTFLPLRLAERSPRPSLAAANGQVLAVRRAAYERAGGHTAVRDRVLDDIALLRAVKRAGGTGGVVDGTRLATCRMYDGWRQVWDGYGKSLWVAYGSVGGALGVQALLVLAYVVPLGTGWWTALVGYGVGVAGRVITARRTGGRVLDSLAHPLSIVGLCVLTTGSLVRYRRHRLTWKSRPLRQGV